MEVKSIKEANLRKTHEKLKEQIENDKGAGDKGQSISINSASRIFGELMDNSIKKSLEPLSGKSKAVLKPENRVAEFFRSELTEMNPKFLHHRGSSTLKTIMNALNSSSEIRLVKTNDVLKRIREGTYETDYLLIADKLLSQYMMMRL